jgi:hypothetical protein
MALGNERLALGYTISETAFSKKKARQDELPRLGWSEGYLVTKKTS